MSLLLTENLISTKEASKISGYNPDYLARLCRAGKISGMRIGKTWCVERESLLAFIRTQEELKQVSSRALSQTRSREYQEARRHSSEAAVALGVSEPIRGAVPAASAKEHIREPIVSPFSPTFLPVQRPTPILQRPSFALGLALWVVALSGYASVSDPFMQITSNAGRLAYDFATTRAVTYDGPVHFLAADDAVSERTIAVRIPDGKTFAEGASRVAAADVALPDGLAQMSAASAEASAFGAIGRERTRTFASYVADPVRALASLRDASVSAYVAVGNRFSHGVRYALNAYVSGISDAGERSLALASLLRDTSARAPEAALAIRTSYERGIYAWAEGSPRLARAITEQTLALGSSLGHSASRAPVEISSIVDGHEPSRASLAIDDASMAINDASVALSDASLGTEVARATDDAAAAQAVEPAAVTDASHTELAAGIGALPATFLQGIVRAVTGAERAFHYAFTNGTRLVADLFRDGPVFTLAPIERIVTILSPGTPVLSSLSTTTNITYINRDVGDATFVNNSFPRTLIGGVAREEVDARFAALAERLDRRFNGVYRSIENANDNDGGGGSSGGNVSLNDPTFTGTLTTDNAVVNNDASVGGNLTVGGDATVTGTLNVGSFSVSNLSSNNTVVAPRFIGTSTSEASVFPNIIATTSVTDNATSTNLYATNFGVGNEYFTDLTGTGLVNTGGVLSVSTASLGAAGLYMNGGNAFGVPAILGTTDAHPLSLITNSTTAATILTNGNFGIGTTSPFTKLSVGGDAYVGGNVTATGTATVQNLSIGSLSGFLKATAGNVATSLVSLASDITGTLPVGNGGTGSTSLTGLLVGNGASPLQTATVTAPLTLTGSTLSMNQANTSQNGFLSNTDWNTFNNKVSSTSLSSGTGISYNPSTGVITNIGVTSTAGDWTGTFDGQEGSYYLANSFSTTSANYWLSTKDTDDLSEGSNLYYTDGRVNTFIAASSTIPKTYGTNLWTGTNTFAAAGLNVTGLANGCVEITGGQFTSTGTNCGTGSGGITSLNGLVASSQTFATTSDTNIGLSVTSSGSTHTFTPTWTGVLAAGRGGTGLGSVTANQLLIGNTSGTGWTQTATSSLGLPTFSDLGNYLTLAAWYATTTDGLDEGAANLYYTDTRARAALSETIAGVDYDSGTGVFSLTTGFTIPLTASTTDWQTAFLWGNHAAQNYFDKDVDDTGDLAEGSNLYYTDDRVNSYIHASTTIPKTYTANTFTALNTFNGGVTVGTLNGPLQANAGLVSATTSIGVLYGGTGLTSAPAYGQLLVGNASGGYTLTATSSLGLVTSAVTSIGPAGQLQSGPAVTLASSTAGTDFTITAAGNAITFNLPTASASSRGLLLSADWSTFNGKENVLTFTYPLTRSSNTISLAFGTTTSNTWAGTQTFTNSPVFSTLGAGTVNSTSGGTLYAIGTSTPTLASELSYSGTLGQFIGGVSGSLSLATNGTALSKLVQIGANTILGNPTGATGNVQAFATSSLGLLTTNVAEGSNLYYTDARVNTFIHSSTTIPKTYTDNIFTGDNTFAAADLFITGLSDGCVEISSNQLTSTGTNCGTGSGGITSLNGLTASSQSFATSSADANIRITVTSTGSTHTFTPSWNGILAAGRGGTGISSVTANELLVGNSGGTGWTQIATSSLGLLTTHVAEGSNLYYTDDRVNAYIHGSTTIPKMYTDNIFTGAQVFSGGVTIGTLNGPLQANSGVVSATTSVGVLYGGTGLTSAPTYGQMLVGNSSGGYTLTATSSLGLVTAAVQNIGPIGQMADGPNVTFATSTGSFNGLTQGITITGSGDTITFAPSLSGTLGVAGGGTGAASFSYGLVLSPGGTGALTNIATSSLGLLTTNVAEGSNLYYTDERVDDRTAVLIQNGTGISWSYDDNANTFTPTVTLAPFTTANLNESGNLYYTDDRVNTFIHSSTTIPKTYTTNTFTALQTFNAGVTSNALTLGALNGPLQANAGVVSATTSVGVLFGGTGLTSAPTYGQMLVGNSSGGYTLTATSSLGLVTAAVQNIGPAGQMADGPNVMFATTTSTANGITSAITIIGSGDIITFTPSQSGTLTIPGGGTGAASFSYGLVLSPGGTNALTNIATSSLGLLTTNVVEGSNLYYTDDRVNAYIHASTTIPKTYTANTFTALNTFNGGVTVGTLNGPLQANNGVVSATTSVGVLYGGTGLTSAPTYGQLLVGNSSGGYTLTATSSLGLVTAAVTSIGPAGQLQTGPAVTIASSSTGTDFTVTAMGNTITFNLPTASASNRGLLSSTDWSTFNDKQAALTFTYPLVNSANTVSLAFGTTTSNTWAGTQTFTNSPVFSTLGAGTVNSTSGGTLYSTGTSTPTLASELSYSGTLGQFIGGVSGSLSLATNGTALSKLVQIGANTILGNPTGATGNVQAFATSSLGIALADTTGTLSVSRGGTGVTSFTAGNLLYGSGSGALQSVGTTTLSGNSQVALSQPIVVIGSSPSVLSIVADSIGDTQLAFNTGQNLTTASSPTFASLTLTAPLTVTNGGTGWASVQSGAVLYGNGTSQLSTTTAGTNGQVLALVGGVPTWVATTTAGTGLTYSAGSFNVNTTQNITRLSNLTSNGFVKTSGGDGTLSVDTNTYLTAAVTSIGPAGQLQTGPAVALASSTAGTDFTITAAGNAITFNLPTASASNRGLLSSTDWSTFNDKQAALTFTYPLVNTTNTISLAFGTTTANTWGALQTFTSGMTTNALTIGTLNGPLQANAGVVSATTSVGVLYGGTGLTSAPTYGQVLVGNGSGGYTLTATSSLGLGSIDGTGSANRLAYWSDADTLTSNANLTFNGTNLSLGTGQYLVTDSEGTPGYSWTGDATTGMYHAGSNTIGFSTGGIERVRIDGSGFLGIGTTTPGAALGVEGNALVNGTLTALTARIGTLNGPLQANAGVVSATTSVGVLYGGTGLTSAPTYGQLLVGNASGGYTLTATSSLGLITAAVQNIGPAGQTADGPTVTFATSTSAFNGLTPGLVITGSGDTLTYTSSLSGTLGVGGGGTGATSLTDHGVLVGSGSSAVDALAVGTNGQILVGSTGADPVFATLNCANGLTCTTGAGTLQVDFDGGNAPGGELGGTWASPTLDAEALGLEELSDVASMTEDFGDLLGWNGTTWADFATSSLGLVTSAITSIGPAGQLQTGPAVTLATSSTAFNGLTSSTTITGAGNTITFANTLSGTLGVAGGGTGATTFTAGLLVGNGTSAVISRVLTGPAAGITITNGSGVAGNPTLVLANDLAALEGLGGTGIAVRTGTDTWAQRTLTGNSQITITNGTGVSGDPTFSITADSIGDTQLAFNTGQNLTTASAPSFTGLTIGTLNGPLQANAGVISATTSIGVLYGGTGLTSAPTFGQMLVGNASGGYTLTATSSLGIFSAIGPAGQTQTGPTVTLATSTSAFNGLTPSLIITGSGNTLTYTSSLSGTLGVAGGGTGAGTLTGLLQGNGTGAITGVTGTAGQFPYYNGTNTLLATSTLFLAANGNIGIGTTTPGSILSIQGIANFTTATSTFYSTGGLNLAGGCFAIAGTCVGGGSGTNYFTNSGIYTYLSTGTNLGIGTTTPWAQLSVNPNGITGPAFAIGSSTKTHFLVTNAGNVAIGSSTASFTNKFAIYGDHSGLLKFGDASPSATFDTFEVQLTDEDAIFQDTHFKINPEEGWVYHWTDGDFSISDELIHFDVGSAPTLTFDIDGTTNTFQMMGGNVGIGTSTPGSLLSIGGIANFTTATSTFYSTGGGINLASGCFAVGGVCVGGGSGTNYWTSSGADLYNNTGTEIGINNASPAYALDVGGFINTDIYSGYRMGGALLGYASSTNFATIFGLEAGGQNATTSASNLSLTAVGYQALTANTTGGGNTALGYAALTANTIGASNTAIGSSAMLVNSSGSTNTAVGVSSLQSNTTGSFNAALGNNALSGNTTGTDSVALGYTALFFNKSATSTVAVGSGAAAGIGGNYSNQGGVYVGYRSAYNALAIGSDFNTFLGYRSGYNVTTGSNNILIGTATSSTAIANLTTGSQNILIGNNISLPSATASGQLNIGNILYGTGITGTGSTISSGRIGIGTTTPAAPLHVYGSFGAVGTVAKFQSSAASNQLAIGVDPTSGTPFVGGDSASGSAVNAISLNPFGGNVGVGSSTPWAQLSVNPNGITGPAFAIGSSTATNFVVTNGGNVGIGNTSPGARLVVAGSNTPLGIAFATSSLMDLRSTATAATNVGPVLTFSGYYAGTTNASVFAYIQARHLGIGDGNSGAASLSFHTSNTVGTVSERMVIDGAGNVGIGTTTPGSLLSIGGIANFTTATSTFYSTGGINLASGCFAIAGTCVGGGSGSNYFTNSGASTYLSTGTNLGIGTTSPFATLSVSGDSSAPISFAAYGYDGVLDSSQVGGSMILQAGAGSGSSGGAGSVGGSITITSGVGGSGLAAAGGAGGALTLQTGQGGAGSPAGSFGQLTLNASGGNVGIATSSPFRTFSVEMGTETHSVWIGNQGSTTPSFTIRGVNGNGNVGIGTTTPWRTFSVDGTVAMQNLTAGLANGSLCRTTGGDVTYNAASSACISSSQRYKHAIADLHLGLDDVMRFRPVSFIYNLDYMPGGATRLGFIAEQLAEIDPSLATYAENGTISGIDDSAIISAVTSGLQELSDQTVSLATSSLAFRLGGIETKVASMPEPFILPEELTATIIHTGELEASAGVHAMRVKADSFMSAPRYFAPASTETFTIGSSTETVLIPDEAISSSGVDLYKLATYSIARLQALDGRMAEFASRLDLIDARLAALEAANQNNGVGGLIAGALNGVDSFFQNLRVGSLFVAKGDDGGSAAGSGTILEGNTVVEFMNPLAKPSSKIFITLTSPVNGSWYLSDKKDGSFRVRLSEAQTDDVTFDYFIVQTEGDDETPQPDQDPQPVPTPEPSPTPTPDPTPTPTPDPEPSPTPTPDPIPTPEPTPDPEPTPEPEPEPEPPPPAPESEPSPESAP